MHIIVCGNTYVFLIVQVGGMTYIIVLDMDERHALLNVPEVGIVHAYKENTLPVLGYYDDFSKLEVVGVTA